MGSTGPLPCPTSLGLPLQEAHEALYEMEMAALEAQRVAQATEAALDDSDDDLNPLRIADTIVQQEVSVNWPDMSFLGWHTISCILSAWTPAPSAGVSTAKQRRVARRSRMCCMAYD